MPIIKPFLLTLTLLLFPATLSYSHHGFRVHYDLNDYIYLQGIVTEFRFINPHAFIYFETIEPNGEKVIHWCETQARTQLMRKGVTPETFKPGTPVKIEGFQARRDPNGCEMAVAHLPNGEKLVLRTKNAHAQYQANIIKGDASIFGTWHIKSFPGGINPKAGEHLTETGKQAHSGYDSLTQNPLLRCSGMSPNRAWSVPGVPTKVYREDEKIIIQHEFMDTIRTVHLDRSTHPDDFERSDMGHSIGTLQDGILNIETAMFSYGALDMEILHSDQLVLRERLYVDPESGELEYNWTASDPEYYSQDLVGQKVLIPTNMEVSSYNCQPSNHDQA